MKIAVAFKFGKFMYEKEMDFVFKISTLEEATELLGCELWELGDQDPTKISIALLYAGYVQSCRRRYRKPIYSVKDAKLWVEKMSKTSQLIYAEACKDLFGKLSQNTEKKKSPGKNSEVSQWENLDGHSTGGGTEPLQSSTMPSEVTGETGNGSHSMP